MKILNISSLISIVLRNLHSTDVIPHSTEGTPTVLMLSPMYWIPSTRLKLSSTMLILSPLYWTTCTVLKVSHSAEAITPHVLLLSPTCTAVIPIARRYPSTVLNTLHSTDVSPTVLMLSPTVLKLYPTVLSNLHSTEAILQSTDVILPMYWTTSNVLNSLYSAELTLYWVEFAVVNLNLPWWTLNLLWWIWICRGEF